MSDNELTAPLRPVLNGARVDPSIYLGERVGVSGHTLGYVADAWVAPHKGQDWIHVKVTIPEPKGDKPGSHVGTS
jgi:hypothetical protein